MQRKRPPEVVVERSPDYKTIIVSGVFGGHRPGFFEAIVYTDELLADEALASIPPDAERFKIKRTLQCRLVIDPVQAKSLLEWLKRHVEQYEKEFGEIRPSPKEEKEQTYIR